MIAVAAIAAVASAAYLTRDQELHPEVSSETFPVGDAPVSVAIGDDIWVANGGSGTLSRLPGGDPNAAEEIEVGGRPSQIALGGGTVWVAYPLGEGIVSLSEDAAPDRKRFTVGRTPAAVAADAEAGYFAALDDAAIWIVDGEGPRRLADLDEGFPSSVAIGFGSLWVTDVVSDQLLRVDLAEGRVEARIDVGTAPTSVIAGEDAIWVANFNDATVTRVDPSTERVTGRPIAVGGKPGGLAEGLGYVWVTRPDDDSVIRIDLETNLWTAEVIEVGDNPTAIAVGDGAVWVANTEDDTVTRLTMPR